MPALHTANGFAGLLSGLRAIAETSRLRLLALCAQGDLTVGDLSAILGQSQPRVSRHLKLLCDAELLDRLPEGNAVRLRLADNGPGGALARQILQLLPAADETLRLDRERLADIRAERAAAAAAYFRKNAGRWSRLRALYADDDQIVAELRRRLPADKDIDLLDVGTGTGRLLEVMAPHIGRGTGIDLSRDMLQVARATLLRAGIGN